METKLKTNEKVKKPIFPKDMLLKTFCAASALAATTPALADLPTADEVVPDAIDADSPLEMGTTVIRLIVQFFAVIIGASVTLGAGAQTYKAFSEAREKNGWEDFFKTAGIATFLIVAVDALCILAFTYASSFTPLG